MTTHTTGTRKEWLAARLDLFKAEKELTRRSDELARQRQGLPVGSARTRTTDSTPTREPSRWRTSSKGRSQLLIYHFMFGPDYTAGCPSCSTIADGFDGFAVHLAAPRCHAGGGVAGAARKTAGIQAANGLDLPLGVVVRAATSTTDFNVWFTEQQQRDGGIRLQLPERGAGAGTGSREHGSGVEAGRQRVAGRADRRDDRNRRRDIHPRQAGHERVRARGRRRLPHVFDLRARTGWSLGYVPVGSTARRPDATRRASGGVATTSTLAVSDRAIGRIRLHVHSSASARSSRRAPVTVAWCSSMSAMGGMPMPGGWTMSMAWMRMPGQTWPARRVHRSSACGP